MVQGLDVAESRALLCTAQVRLEKMLSRRDGIAVERSPDTSDEAQFALDRDLTVSTLDRESRLRVAVKRALARVDDGTYGICQRCENTIAVKRLAAVPWAGYCIRCQDILDSECAGLSEAGVSVGTYPVP